MIHLAAGWRALRTFLLVCTSSLYSPPAHSFRLPPDAERKQVSHFRAGSKGAGVLRVQDGYEGVVQGVRVGGGAVVIGYCRNIVDIWRVLFTISAQA